MNRISAAMTLLTLASLLTIGALAPSGRGAATENERVRVRLTSETTSYALGLSLQSAALEAIELEVERKPGVEWVITPLTPNSAQWIAAGHGETNRSIQTSTGEVWRERSSQLLGQTHWVRLNLASSNRLRLGEPHGPANAKKAGLLSRCEDWGQAILPLGLDDEPERAARLTRTFTAVLRRYRASGYPPPKLRRTWLGHNQTLALCGDYEINVVKPVQTDNESRDRRVTQEALGSYHPMEQRIEIEHDLSDNESERILAHELFHSTHANYAQTRAPTERWIEEGLATLATESYSQPRFDRIARDPKLAIRSLQSGLASADGESEYQSQDYWHDLLSRQLGFTRLSQVQPLLKDVRDLATLERYLVGRGTSLLESYSAYALEMLRQSAGNPSARARLTPWVVNCQTAADGIAFANTSTEAEQSGWASLLVDCRTISSAEIDKSPGIKIVKLDERYERVTRDGDTRYLLVINAEHAPKRSNSLRLVWR